MKYLATLFSALFIVAASAQQMPYNPDANGDDFVGVDDVLGVLGVYDTALMQPDLSCDYEGTDLEQLFAGIVNGDLVLDSLYVEYYYADSVQTYVPPCPDPIFVETVLARSYTLVNFNFWSTTNGTEATSSTSYLNFLRSFTLNFTPNTGDFQLYLQDYEIGAITPFGAYSYATDLTGDFGVPFPEQWELNEDGIQITWYATSWAANCQSLRVIPFWHETE